MDIYFAIFSVAWLFFWGLVFVNWGVKDERKRWNGGVCPRCKVKLKFMDEDSVGERGYHCPNCWRVVWIGHWRVDKEYWEGIQ